VGASRKQELLLVERKNDHFEQSSLGPVSFVPLVADS
jgi:protein-L-isoaspartate O-methyltransferase